MGVVHHSHYPVYFEQGRSDFFIKHLRPYPEFEAQGILAPVLSYQVEILGRAVYGHVLRVCTRADWMKGIRLQMSYDVEVEETLVARGHSLHALVDLNMKAVNPRKFGQWHNLLLQVFPLL